MSPMRCASLDAPAILHVTLSSLGVAISLRQLIKSGPDYLRAWGEMRKNVSEGEAAVIDAVARHAAAGHVVRLPIE